MYFNTWNFKWFLIWVHKFTYLTSYVKFWTPWKEGLYRNSITPKILSIVLSPAIEPLLYAFDNFNPYSNLAIEITKQLETVLLE